MIALAGLLLGCAQPAVVAQCPIPVERLFVDILEADGDIEIREMTALQREAFMRNLNALPPETNYVFDRVFVIGKRGVPAARVMFTNRGCVEQYQDYPLPVVERMMLPTGFSA